MSDSGPKPVSHRPSSKRKIDDIVDAAREEFFAKGFSAASIEAIAARAGVSKVTIYNHFGDKETLFSKVLEKQIDQMRKIFEIAKLEHESLREILMDAGMAMLNFLTQQRAVRFERMLAAEVNRDPKIGALFLDAGPRSLLKSLSNLLQAAIDNGEIQSDDVAASAEMFPGLLFGRLDIMLRYGWKPDLSDEAKSIRVKRAVNAWMLIHTGENSVG